MEDKTIEAEIKKQQNLLEQFHEKIIQLSKQFFSEKKLMVGG